MQNLYSIFDRFQLSVPPDINFTRTAISATEIIFIEIANIQNFQVSLQHIFLLINLERKRSHYCLFYIFFNVTLSIIVTNDIECQKKTTVLLTLTAYPVASNASSPIKKSRSSTPLYNLRLDWSPTFADSLMAIADGMINCGSLFPANPSLVYLQGITCMKQNCKLRRRHYPVPTSITQAGSIPAMLSHYNFTRQYTRNNHPEK